jgi:hypothetical protein
MDEASLYESLRPRLQALGLDPHRVENVLARGTPDINYSGGWIELKHVPRWPVYATTPVRIPSLVDRPEQAAWLTRRWLAGGPAWLLVRVDRQLLLVSGLDSQAVRGGLTHERLLVTACWRSDDKYGRFSDAAAQRLRAWLLWRDEELPPWDRAKLLRLRCGHPVNKAAALLGTTPALVERAEAEPTEITNDLIDAWVA